MEVIKDLPEVFEEFAEQRKNSFLAIKKIKDQNIPVIGSYCTYFSTGDRDGDGCGFCRFMFDV